MQLGTVAARVKKKETAKRGCADMNVQAWETTDTRELHWRGKKVGHLSQCWRSMTIGQTGRVGKLPWAFTRGPGDSRGELDVHWQQGGKETTMSHALKSGNRKTGGGETR